MSEGGRSSSILDTATDGDRTLVAGVDPGGLQLIIVNWSEQRSVLLEPPAGSVARSEQHAQLACGREACVAAWSSQLGMTQTRAFHAQTGEPIGDLQEISNSYMPCLATDGENFLLVNAMPVAWPGGVEERRVSARISDSNFAWSDPSSDHSERAPRFSEISCAFDGHRFLASHVRGPDGGISLIEFARDGSFVAARTALDASDFDTRSQFRILSNGTGAVLAIGFDARRRLIGTFISEHEEAQSTLFGTTAEFAVAAVPNGPFGVVTVDAANGPRIWIAPPNGGAFSAEGGLTERGRSANSVHLVADREGFAALFTPVFEHVLGDPTNTPVVLRIGPDGHRASAEHPLEFEAHLESTAALSAGDVALVYRRDMEPNSQPMERSELRARIVALPEVVGPLN